MLADRAFAWARGRTLDALSKRVQVESRQVFGDHERLVCLASGRACHVTLSIALANVEVAFATPVVPTGLRIDEASSWGHQRQEAWESGEAAPTGDFEFDSAFMVLGAEPGTRAAAEEARRIPSAMRSVLLAQRGAIRDAELTRERLRLLIRPSRSKSNETPAVEDGSSGNGAAWKLGTVFLGFDKMPSARDLEQGITRAVQLATLFETASEPV